MGRISTRSGGIDGERRAAIGLQPGRRRILEKVLAISPLDLSILGRLVAPRTRRGEPPSERIPPADLLAGGRRGCKRAPTCEGHGGGDVASQALKPDGPGRYPTRIAESHREIEGSSVKLEETTRIANGGSPARTASGAARAVRSRRARPGRERRPLESYFQEIGGTRTLRREEEVILAKELEAATADLRDALYSIPCSAQHVIDRWDALRALSHTGAKLSESVGAEETGRDRRARRASGQAPARAAAAAREGDGQRARARRREDHPRAQGRAPLARPAGGAAPEGAADRSRR